MTVVNPKSISGINSITTGSGSDNLLTIHTNDGTERVRVDNTGATKIVTGIVTTLSVTGNANIGGVLTYEDVTNVDSIGIITARSNVLVGSGITLSPDGDVFTAGVTTSTTVQVGGGVTISESGIEASGIGITVANINGSQISGRRNIIINGAANIAQRAASATSVSGEYKTVDRFSVSFGGADEAPTEAQHDLSSSDTPYALGFRKSFHLTNGNQTSGAGSADYLQPQYKIEAQDIATCGWNYTDSNSFITLSFWVKASVAGDYTLNVGTSDGTAYRYLMEYTLVADTWKHVVFKIPGNSNLTMDNDTGLGFQIMWYPFLGSDYVQADQENNWYASSNSKYGTTSTTSWWTTNDATWEITGVQLEVGSQATAFEHRTFGDELLLCQRYYRAFIGGTYTCFPLIGRKSGSSTIVADTMIFPPMRVHGADQNGTLLSFGSYRRLSDNAAANLTGTNTVKILNTNSSGYNYGTTVRFTVPSDSGSTNQQFAHINTSNRLHFQLQAEL